MSRSGSLVAALPLLLAASVAAVSPSAAQPGASCLADQIFRTQSLVSVGFVQRKVRAADLNGDGVMDLVISTSGGILIELGSLSPTGQLTYQQSASYAGISDATGVAIADFNGDGIPDLAVASDGGGFFIFNGQGVAGKGTGQFTQSAVFSIGSVWDVAAGDINGDGITDLVVGLRAGGIQPFIGLGAGGVGNGLFAQGAVVTFPGSTKGIVLADMDHDGVLDVVASGENASVFVLQGQSTGGVANGTFTLATTVKMDGTTFDVAVADFNSDGTLDIASANYTASSMSIALGGPALTFRQAINHLAPGQPLGVAVGDFNHDGRPDIVLAAAGSGSAFSYFENRGPTSSQPDGFTSSVSFGGARISYGILATDLNLDGTLDVVVPGLGDNTLLEAFDLCNLSRPVLVVNVVGTGTVTRTPDQPDYDLGQVVQITATPGAGFFFQGWSGDATGTANPISITMNSSHSVTATFIAITHVLTTSTTGAGHGAVSRSPDLARYPEGSTLLLTATAAFGSAFAGWSGDATGTDDSLLVTMDTDKSIVARFEPDTLLSPLILSATDVPLDQGGKLKLRWRASSAEAASIDPQNLITQYFIWREIPQSAFAAAQLAGSASADLFRRTTAGAREYFWEFVTSQPASRFAGYSYTAVTTNDSTERGNPFTLFMVQARNAASTRWWDSPPDSGYSVDNLAPPTPGPFVGQFGGASNSFHWGASRAPDLSGYRIYRGTSRDFAPSDANLIGTPRDTAFVDASPLATFYKLAAIDVHGNLSHFVVVSPDGPVATLASLVSSEAAADHIALTFYVTQPGLAATLYKRTLASDWAPLAALFADGQSFIRFRDADITRGETYGYRLGIQEAGGESFFAETYVVAEDTRFALQGVVPNPAPGGRMTVRFTLPSTAPGTLELLDVTGRRVDQRTFAGQAGQRSVELGGATRIPPGLYWLRLRHAGREGSIRAVVLD